MNKLLDVDVYQEYFQNNLYNSTIINWTIKNLLKRKYTKENNLNYLEFFSINEVKLWIDNYEKT